MSERLRLEAEQEQLRRDSQELKLGYLRRLRDQVAERDERICMLTARAVRYCRTSAARNERYEAEIERLRIDAEQARAAAVARAAEDPRWSAVYAWLDSNKNKVVKMMVDDTGHLEREVARLTVENKRLRDEVRK